MWYTFALYSTAPFISTPLTLHTNTRAQESSQNSSSHPSEVTTNTGLIMNGLRALWVDRNRQIAYHKTDPTVDFSKRDVAWLTGGRFFHGREDTLLNSIYAKAGIFPGPFYLRWYTCFDAPSARHPRARQGHGLTMGHAQTACMRSTYIHRNTFRHRPSTANIKSHIPGSVSSLELSDIRFVNAITND